VTAYLFDLSTIHRSELFYTDMEKHPAQGDECRALYQTPPAPRAFVPVVYASVFKEPQPVDRVGASFDVAKYVANKKKPRS
jgi:hypothetical protein